MIKAYDRASSVCPECGSRKIIQDGGSGEIICVGCGLVIADSPISTDPEWRAFTLKEMETRTRVGIPPSFSISDKGLSTMIGPIYTDSYGKRIPQEKKIQFLRIRKWNIRSRIHYAEDRNLATAMSDLNILSEKLHIPSNVQEKAAVIYRRALRKGLIRGRSILSMVAASLYAACRETYTPRTIVEIERHIPRDKTEIARCYRKLLNELNIRMPVTKAQLMVPKIASKVEVGEEIQRKAIEILEEADRLKITLGKDPTSLAAAAIYLVCATNGVKRTQRVIATAAGVSEVTIRTRSKEFRRFIKN